MCLWACFIPFHIRFNGSIRLGSQATCEQAIEDIGHGIRSKKSPFKNIVSYKADKQAVRLLHLIYPSFSAPKEITPKKSLFKPISNNQKQGQEDDDLKVHLDATIK